MCYSTFKYVITINIFIPLLFVSCGTVCNCSDKDIYQYSYKLGTGDGVLRNIYFPEPELLNIIRENGQIIVDDTSIFYYQDYMVYEHFTYVYECKLGKLYRISSSEEQTPKSNIEPHD